MNLASFLDRGGAVIYALLIFSVIALAVIMLKTWQLWRARFSDENPAARLGAALAEARARGVIGEALETVAQIHAEREMARLQSGMRWLEATAALSPLLGLLGTVTGMIRAFRDLEEAGATSDPALLSGGIWEALLTTAAGLIIAVPVLAALALFESVIAGLRQDMRERALRALQDE